MPEGESKQLFGTDGIRGVAGEYPLDEPTVKRIGRAITMNLTGEFNHRPSIVIGRDTRESGEQIERWLAEGARAAGALVESAGVITTPGVAFVTRSTPFDAGLVISASHNPYRDNGIKVFSQTGKKLADDVERKIESDIAVMGQPGLDNRSGVRNQIAADQDRSLSEVRFKRSYVDYLVSNVAQGLSLEQMRIAIDCANGAASEIAPEVLKHLGGELEVLSAAPNGKNINEDCGSLHTHHLQKTVVDGGFDLGIAFDGDADRALFVDGNGQLIDGDYTLLILADYLKHHGLLTGDLVVATVMSNIGLEIALRERNITLVRAQVGDRYVLEELIARDAKLGGEQSGHIIFPNISLAGDGIITAIEMLKAIKESGHTLAELAAQMTRFPQVLVNVRVSSKPPMDSIPEVRSEIERLEEEMQGRGRLLVRYSGTENLARVMIEGENQTVIQEQADRLAGVIKRAVG